MSSDSILNLLESCGLWCWRSRPSGEGVVDGLGSWRLPRQRIHCWTCSFAHCISTLPLGDRARSECKRQEERRVGQECVSTVRPRWSPFPYKHNTKQITLANN